MKIGIFGDSYSSKFSSRYDDHTWPYKGWPELLEEKYQTKIASLRDSYKVVIQVEKLKEGSL